MTFEATMAHFPDNWFIRPSEDEITRNPVKAAWKELKSLASPHLGRPQAEKTEEAFPGIIALPWKAQSFDGSHYEQGLTPEQRVREICEILASIAHRVVAGKTGCPDENPKKQ